MSESEKIGFPFPTTLEIRAQLALANIHQRCNLGDYFTLVGWALAEAGRAAYHAAERENADVPCPVLFLDEPMLVHAWNRGIQLAADKRYRWYSKENLPNADTLYGLLSRGQRCEINGHSLSPDEHGVWITSPYGNDCGLWQDLKLERVEEFLRDMAAGEEYGPTP